MSYDICTRLQFGDSPGMVFEIALLAAGLLLTLQAINSRRRTSEDPDWEKRWNQLPQVQRDHIADAVRRGIPLTDPTEAELATGLARRERSSASFFACSGPLHMLLASALIATALIGPSPLILAPLLLLLAFLIWVAYRERITKRNLARAEAAAPPT
jgi:Flp pilus assembly protein TadB